MWHQPTSLFLLRWHRVLCPSIKGMCAHPEAVNICATISWDLVFSYIYGIRTTKFGSHFIAFCVLVLTDGFMSSMMTIILGHYKKLLQFNNKKQASVFLAFIILKINDVCHICINSLPICMCYLKNIYSSSSSNFLKKYFSFFENWSFFCIVYPD